MANEITLRVITPEAVVLDTTVDSVSVPGLDGSMGILKSHAPMVAALATGDLSYRAGGAEEHLFIGAGFCEVRQNTVRVVTDASERPTDIDVARAEQASQRARERMRVRQVEGSDAYDAVRAQASLRRAMMRMKVAKRG